MYIESARSQSDYIGALASGLCVVHCIATPFLFLAQAQSCSATGCCEGGPWWWSYMDYLFIGITFFAVYWSARTTANAWVKNGLYISWFMLSLLMVNEKMGWLPLTELWKYGAALTLVTLHLYNRRYCQCADDKCVAT